MAAGISRRKLAQYCADKIKNGHSEDVARQLAAYLLTSGRVREVDLVVRDIEAELYAHGIILATVTTARPLSEAVRRQVVTLLKGKTVKLREVVDANELAGIRIELPGQLYDATLRRRVESLKELARA